MHAQGPGEQLQVLQFVLIEGMEERSHHLLSSTAHSILDPYLQRKSHFSTSKLQAGEPRSMKIV